MCAFTWLNKPKPGATVQARRLVDTDGEAAKVAARRRACDSPFRSRTLAWSRTPILFVGEMCLWMAFPSDAQTAIEIEGTLLIED